MNYPKLNFSKKGDYKLNIFKDIVLIERGGSPRPIHSFLTTNEAGVNWIKIGDVSPEDKYILKTATKIKESGVSLSKFIIPGDLLLSNSMSYGRPYISKISGCIHDGWLLIRDENELFDKEYLCYLLSTNSCLTQYKKMASGGMVNNLNKDLVGNLKIAYPQIDIQKKIASFLALVDQKINLQKKKKNFLQQYKKQFYEFFLKDLVKTEYYLKDILNERKEFAKKSEAYPHVSLARNGLSYKDESKDYLVMDEQKKYKITRLNDICYNPANLKFDVICLNELGTALFSPIYITYEVKYFNPKFIIELLPTKEFINQARRFEKGSVIQRTAVSSEDFLKCKIALPEIEYQNEYIKIIDAINKKIALTDNTLEQLLETKQILLQQMFI